MSAAGLVDAWWHHGLDGWARPPGSGDFAVPSTFVRWVCWPFRHAGRVHQLRRTYRSSFASGSSGRSPSDLLADAARIEAAWSHGATAAKIPDAGEMAARCALLFRGAVAIASVQGGGEVFAAARVAAARLAVDHHGRRLLTDPIDEVPPA